MSCDICIDADVDGSSDGFFYRRRRTARKLHKCEECRGEIKPGEAYDVVGGKYEGRFWEEKICLICHEIAKAFYCGGVRYGNIWDELHDYVIPELTVNSSCFNSLGVEARKVLTDKWWEWKESHAG
jgi:hypothetical protein